MRRSVIVGLVLAVLAPGLQGCEQGEGERCQLNRDCAPLVCVESNALGSDGRCCPVCSTGTEVWQSVLDSDGNIDWRCGCTSGAGDADADVDADADADADVDGDGAADGALDGDVEDDPDSGADGGADAEG